MNYLKHDFNTEQIELVRAIYESPLEITPRLMLCDTDVQRFEKFAVFAKYMLAGSSMPFLPTQKRTYCPRLSRLQFLGFLKFCPLPGTGARLWQLCSEQWDIQDYGNEREVQKLSTRLIDAQFHLTVPNVTGNKKREIHHTLKHLFSNKKFPFSITSFVVDAILINRHSHLLLKDQLLIKHRLYEWINQYKLRCFQ